MESVIGVIGTGAMAREHVAGWTRFGRPVVILSRSPERAAELASAYAAGTASSLDGLLESCSVVDLCTPTDTHPTLIDRSAAAGRHVVCEKPLARDLTAARRAAHTCRSAGVELLVAHRLRYVPAYAAAAELVRSGRIGTPLGLELERRVERPPAGSWFGDPARSGGVLVDLAIHDDDYARWVAGEVATVEATAERDASGLATRCRVELGHRYGARTVVSASWEPPGTPFAAPFTVRGTVGELCCDATGGRLVESTADGVERVVPLEDVDPFEAQFGDFLAAIEEGRTPRVTAQDAVAAVAIASAAEASAANGGAVHPVSLPPHDSA